MQTTTPTLSVQLRRLQRKPVRLSVTINAALLEALLQRSLVEGRSLSNLCAFLLEAAMAGYNPTK